MSKEADWAVNTLTGLLGSPNLNGKQGITRHCSGIDGSQRKVPSATWRCFIIGVQASELEMRASSGFVVASGKEDETADPLF